MRPLLFLISIILYFGSSVAQAGIQVFPTRLTLSETKNIAEFTVRNNHEDKRTFEIVPIFYQFGKNGEVLAEYFTPNKDINFLAPFIRFSPQKITLLPSDSQLIRVFIPPGFSTQKSELRAHMLVRESEEVDNTEADKGSDNFQAKLTAKISVAIPIIYRSIRSLPPSLELKNIKAKINEEGIQVQFDWHISGDISSHANFKYILIDKNGNESLAQEVNGMTNYGEVLRVQNTLKDKEAIKDKAFIKIEINDTENMISKTYTVRI